MSEPTASPRTRPPAPSLPALAPALGAATVLHVLVLLILARLLAHLPVAWPRLRLVLRHLRPSRAPYAVAPRLPGQRPTRAQLHLARILYAIGPRPRTGMRALPTRAPTPRQSPPIRPPPRKTAARPDRRPTP